MHVLNSPYTKLCKCPHKQKAHENMWAEEEEIALFLCLEENVHSTEKLIEP